MRKLPRLRFRFIVAEEYQPLQVISAWLWALILAAAALQISFKQTHQPEPATAQDLPPAPSARILDAAAFGDHPALSKLLSLWLQSFDYQQGISLSFHDLDYDLVAEWLDEILTLDPRAEYPLFNATRIYAGIRGAPEKQRIMLEFIRKNFRESPGSRWRWMASAVTIAKHYVKDLDFATAIARELYDLTEDLEHVPAWAKQMRFFIASDTQEHEDMARLLLNLVESGQITDPHEFVLLFERLETMYTDLIAQGRITSKADLDKMEATLEKLRRSYLEALERSKDRAEEEQEERTEEG